jgi:type IV pilus assembly protein PilE
MTDDAKAPNTGFSLIELLVVVAVVAILAAVAYPTYQEQVASARRADMKAELMRLAQYMERVYTETGCYNPGDDNNCNEGTPGAPDIGTTSEYYSVAFAAGPTATTFTLEATPITGSPQEGDGKMGINQLGERYWDENRNGDIDSPTEDDWERG